jgi:uncharacterized protein (UPF0212 family)
VRSVAVYDVLAHGHGVIMASFLRVESGARGPTARGRMSKQKRRKAEQGAVSPQVVRQAKQAVILVFAVFLLFAVVLGVLVWRGMSHEHGPRLPKPESHVDLANDRCPTCGENCGDAFVDWRHLRVHLARTDCKAAFRSAPEKNLDSLGVDWRAAEACGREINHLEGQARADALARAEANWRVIPLVTRR